jgi:hypothetical protein
MPDPQLRAADSDREAVAATLGRALSEGRLAVDEYEERLAKAYAARTYGALWALVADLPAGPLPYPDGQYPGALPGVPYPQAGPAVPLSAEPDTSWHSAAALVITALVIFTLAALVTAIATAHAQPLGFQQVPFPQGPVQQAPFQHAELAPFITKAGGHVPGHAPMPVRP